MKNIVLVADDLTPVAAYATIRDQIANEPSFLLESATGGEKWGRYSMIGLRPKHTITLDLIGDETVLRVTETRTRKEVRTEKGTRADALALLRKATGSAPAAMDASIPRVVDAAVGYIAYDMVYALEPVRQADIVRQKGNPAPANQAPTPTRLAHLFAGATTIVFDSLDQTVAIYAETSEDIEFAVQAISKTKRLPPMNFPDRLAVPAGMTESKSDNEYAKMVTAAKEYVAAGDVFQVVLGRTFSVPRNGLDPFSAYRALRILNPSPYLYYLEFGPSDWSDLEAIAGASPETLVRLEQGEVSIRPIAGTRPRGRSPEEDDRISAELLADPKERAEHVMLVDLARNDVGRVAEIGTVKVQEKMVIERYSHVMHIVSHVVGKLKAGADAWDVLGATFPAGTLAGAPKVRAMQIIEELEGSSRGVYGGAIGYVSRHGTMDFAIAIRTLYARKNVIDVLAGAGIVEASAPLFEAAEGRHKASAVLAAVDSAQKQ